jgi:hypothetical protein
MKYSVTTSIVLFITLLINNDETAAAHERLAIGQFGATCTHKFYTIVMGYQANVTYELVKTIFLWNRRINKGRKACSLTCY